MDAAGMYRTTPMVSTCTLWTLDSDMMTLHLLQIIYWIVSHLNLQRLVGLNWICYGLNSGWASVNALFLCWFCLSYKLQLEVLNERPCLFAEGQTAEELYSFAAENQMVQTMRNFTTQLTLNQVIVCYYTRYIAVLLLVVYLIKNKPQMLASNCVVGTKQCWGLEYFPQRIQMWPFFPRM